MVKTNITCRHFKAHDTLIDYINEKIGHLTKYNEYILHVDVILDYEKSVNSIKNCELIAKVNNKLFTSKESSDDFMKSVDMAIVKIGSQITKYKDKLKKKKFTNKEMVNSI
jgi:putative sigma-54 modulation protein